MPIRSEHEEPVEPAREPTIVGDRDDGPGKLCDALLERVRRMEVEVVGRLVEQQHRRAGEFEEQNLQSRLLSAGQVVVLLFGCSGQSVTVERAARRFTPHSVSVFVAHVQDLEQRISGQIRPGVGLRKQSGTYPGTERRGTTVLDRRDVERLDG